LSQGLKRTFNKEPAIVPADEAVNTFKLMNALLDEHSKLLREMRDVERLRIPQGKTYPMTFTLDINRNKVVYIDFLDDSDTRGIPHDAFANPPYTKLRSIQIANDAGGGDVNFATNDAPLQSAGRGGTIKSGSATAVSFDFPVIESLTVALATDATSSATVRILGLS
jgi:hypothetical protein